MTAGSGRRRELERPFKRATPNSYIAYVNSVVSEKGQVTIPKALRDRLGIKPGQVLEFSEEQGRLVAVKVRRKDPIDRVYGVLQLDRGTDELMNELRGQADVA